MSSIIECKIGVIIIPVTDTFHRARLQVSKHIVDGVSERKHIMYLKMISTFQDIL